MSETRNLKALVAEHKKLNAAQSARAKAKEEEELRRVRTASARRLEMVLSDMGVLAPVELSPTGYMGTEAAITRFFFEGKKVLIAQPIDQVAFYYKVDGDDMAVATRPESLVARLAERLGR